MDEKNIETMLMVIDFEIKRLKKLRRWVLEIELPEPKEPTERVEPDVQATVL